MHSIIIRKQQVV